MKVTGKVWIFYDRQAQKQSRPLSTVQAQMMILKIKTHDPDQFLIWTPGWNEWQSLPEFLASEQDYFVVAPDPVSPAPPPPPTPDADDEPTLVVLDRPEDHAEESASEMYTKVLDVDNAPLKKSDYGYFYEDFSADKLDPHAKHGISFKIPSKKTSARDRRFAERHNLKIEVVLITKNGRSFKTYSENISLGGTLLEDELPKDFLNARFDLILINKFERNPAKGRLQFQGRIVGDFANPRRLMFIDSDETTLKKLKELLKSYAEAQKQAKSGKSTA